MSSGVGTRATLVHYPGNVTIRVILLIQFFVLQCCLPYVDWIRFDWYPLDAIERTR